MMCFANHLINRGATSFRFAIGRRGGKGSTGTVKVRIDPRFVTTHLVNVPHDQQFVAERLQRLKHTVKPLGSAAAPESPDQKRH